MARDTAPILSHVPNSGIVQMPGRRFPGVVMQGDSLSNIFDHVAQALRETKSRGNEEVYDSLLGVAETLRGHLLHYEETLFRLGIPLPYRRSVKERLI